MDSSLISFLPLILVIVFMYFMMIRPQQKKEKEIRELRKNLKNGDEIITVGGVKGKIISISDDFITIETSSNKTTIEFTKSAVLSLVNKSVEAAEVAKETPETTE